jgi:hypothetical protein
LRRITGFWEVVNLSIACYLPIGSRSDVNKCEKETLRLSSKIKGLSFLARAIEESEGITGLRSGTRTRKVPKARRLFCQLAAGKMGYPGTEIARFLGVLLLLQL